MKTIRWIALLFAVGSVCFALGALPPYATAVGTHNDNVTFFVGSLFFTSASFLQFRQSAQRSTDWWAALIQLVGTVFFNVTTWHALVGDATNQTVWRPDALGSICFLVSSFMWWRLACQRLWAWLPHNRGWWIAALNLVGSIAFGVSAIASRIQPNGELRNLALTNLGTFVGALCFLAGSVLLFRPNRS